MTVKELKVFFKEHLVPSHLYNLKGGSHGGRICLGKNKQDGWEVYFSEKKNKIGLMQFATENEACHHMMDEICKVMEQIYGITWRGLA